MKIHVDRSKCQGHAMCHAQGGDLFPLDELGYTALNGEIDVPAGQEQLAENAVKVCPERAITIVGE